MATQAEINAVDRAITDLSNRYAEQFQTEFNEFLISWSQLPDPYDRVAVNNLLGQLRDSLANFIDESDAISAAMIELNGGASGLETTVAEIKSRIYLNNSIGLEEEVNSIMGLILVAGVASAVGIIMDARNRTAIIDRIRYRFDQSIIGLSSEITRVLGESNPNARYRYTGGVIPTTRPFCSKHNNKTYTVAEINRIWSGDWQGKIEGGNPFTTRGGFNCRHIWILDNE